MLVQELSLDECRIALAEARFGRLGCAHDNQPYVVPCYFAVDDDYLYAFSLPGQKLDWMRQNPRVCVEIDAVNAGDDWMSVVVVGRFEELPDMPEYRPARARAHDLLRERPMWWEPGAVVIDGRDPHESYAPVFYRISIEHATGHRGVPAPKEAHGIAHL